MKGKKMQKIMVYLMFLLMSANAFGAAANMAVTVAGGGGGPNDGLTWANAFSMAEFITDITTLTEAGDKYYIEDGGYTTGAAITALGGTEAAPIHVIGVKTGTTNEPGSIVFSDYSIADVDKPVFTTAGNTFTFNAYYQIQNISVISAEANGFNLAAGGFQTLINCKSVNSNGIGIHIQGANVWLIDCEADGSTDGIETAAACFIKSCQVLDSTIGIDIGANIATIIDCVIDSCPTGIDVAPDGMMWFVERDGNRLGSLDPDTGIITDTYQYSRPDSRLEDVDVENNDSVYFTAPGVDRLVNFQLSRWPADKAFFDIWAPNSQLLSVAVANDGYPWVTAPGTNWIGRYTPTTLSDWRWYPVSAADAGLSGIAVGVVNGRNRTWFAETQSGKMGQLVTSSSGSHIRLWEQPLPSINSQPIGIAADSEGHVWIAESGANKIAEWRPPYYHSIFAPLIAR